MHRTTMLRSALAIAALLCALAAGCAGFTLDDARAFRQEAASLREDLARQGDELESLAASLPPGSPLRADADATLTATRAKQAALDAAVARLDRALAEADHPTDGLTLAAGTLGALLPEPFRLPLLLGGALAATLLRARQLKAGAASIAASIAKAMQADPELRASVARHANTLRAIQTPTARRIVDEITRPGPILRLPI